MKKKEWMELNLRALHIYDLHIKGMIDEGEVNGDNVSELLKERRDIKRLYAKLRSSLR